MTKEELNNYIPKGDLEGFPKEIIAKMLDCQEEQGNKKDVTVFEKDKYADRLLGAFDWELTKDTLVFWKQVISLRDFDFFFEKYPKQGVHSECKECRKQEYQESKTDKYVQVGDNAILSDITSTQSSVETEINTTDDNSQEFRVGDKVYDILLQEVGVVQDILHSSSIPYGLSVEFKSRVKLYTLNGCDFEYKNPQLLHYRNDYDYDVIDFNNLPKRQDPKRWRGENGRLYYFVNFFTNDWFFSDETKDVYDPIDDANYNSGNYFSLEVEAEIIAQKMNTYFKQLIEEEHEHKKH